MSFSRLVVLAIICSTQVVKSDFFGPMYTCAGPYACLLSSYLGIKFPDGSTQSTAAVADGDLEIGTIDTGTPSANGAQLTAGSLIMQSASVSKPGLVNLTTQSFAGAKTFTGVIAVNSATAATNAALVFKNGHLKSTQTTAPTAAPNANAGTSATCTVANATDAAGVITLTTTATSPSLGAQCAVTFNAAYGVAPVCVFSPKSANSAVLAVSSGIYMTTGTTALTVNFAALDAIGHTYVLAYQCVETQ